MVVVGFWGAEIVSSIVAHKTAKSPKSTFVPVYGEAFATPRFFRDPEVYVERSVPAVSSLGVAGVA